MTFGVLAFMPAVASAQVCVVGIFAAAAYIGAQEHRELTTKEALTCGLSYLFDNKKDEPKTTTKKKARQAKKL